MVKAGQKLRSTRLKNDLTLEDVSQATKIKLEFLSAIENAEYKKLPSSTYAQGFVRNYARFLGVDEKEILAIFRREYDDKKAIKVLPEGLSKKGEFPISRIKFSESFKLVIIIFAVLIGYILFQYRYAVINPPLTINSPKEGDVVSSQKVAVIGRTDPNASVFIDDNSVSIDKNGNFKKTISLFIGKTTIKIKVINFFGRETVVERHIEVK